MSVAGNITVTVFLLLVMVLLTLLLLMLSMSTLNGTHVGRVDGVPHGSQHGSRVASGHV